VDQQRAEQRLNDVVGGTLPGGALPGGAGGSNDTQLLDFLLGP
jgi:hypothetical protein